MDELPDWDESNRSRLAGYDRRTAGAQDAHHSGENAFSEPDLPAGTVEVRDLPAFRPRELPDRVLRLDAENLNRLLGLAGESLVESRWLRPFADSLQRVRREQLDLSQKLELLRSMMQAARTPEHVKDQLNEVTLALSTSRQLLAERLQDLEKFDRRSTYLSHRLYLEVMRTRMRPFAEGVRRFPRMVRDLARSLGKEVRLEIEGEQTQVDREILEQLEAPLAHLLRNAVDHGCQLPAERSRRGEAPENVIMVEARHSAGMLVVSVADDGTGLDLEHLREAIIRKGLASPALAGRLGDQELLEYLFLPGFSLSATVTEISGRGVGLDAVQDMVKTLRGSVRLQNRPGAGFRVQLQLPLTLSVMRAAGGSRRRAVCTAIEPGDQNTQVEAPGSILPRRPAQLSAGLAAGRDTDRAPVAGMRTALRAAPRAAGGGNGTRNTRYGLVFDRLLGERELVVEPLDSRLGQNSGYRGRGADGRWRSRPNLQHGRPA